MNRLLALAFVALGATALAACDACGFPTPNAVCAFTCDFGTGNDECLPGYSCRPDNLCKRDDLADNFACPDTPATIDGAVADAPVIDAPTVDAPVVDASVIDAPDIDAQVIDAPAIDAPAIDAPAIDAPTDAFAGLSITTAGPVDFGSTPMGTPVTRTVMVTNNGSAQTTAITVTVTGTDFSLGGTGDTCTGQLVAGSGGVCQFDVLFTPSAAVSRTGMAEVMATTGGMSSIALQGTGT